MQKLKGTDTLCFATACENEKSKILVFKDKEIK